MGDWDYQDLSQTDLTGLPPEEFIGRTIIGSCLGRLKPRTVVFPEGTRDVRFEGCNLDNVLLPPGSVLVDKREAVSGLACCNRQFAQQRDGEFWLVDDKGAPTKPVREAEFDRLGLSKSPASIAIATAEKPIVDLAEDAKRETDIAAAKQLLADSGLGHLAGAFGADE